MAFTAASIGELGDLAQRHGVENTAEGRSSSKGGRAMYGGSLVMLDNVQNIVGSTGRFFLVIFYQVFSIVAKLLYTYKCLSLCLMFGGNTFSRPLIKIKV